MTSPGSQTATHSSGHGGATATASASQSAGSAEGTNVAAELGVGNGGVSAAVLFAAALVAL